MRLIVTGGRDNYNWSAVRNALDQLDPDVIYQGGAKGTDEQARQWGNSRGKFVVTYHFLKQVGPGGGPRRNHFMIQDTMADFVLAMAGGDGTASCVKLAKEAGIEVIYGDKMCEVHRWVDPSNEVVTAGATRLCADCGMLKVP